MKRLAVVSVYDGDGEIDDYLVYYLQKLSKVASNIVVIVNGILSESSQRKLYKCSSEIRYRENRGYDVGAYVSFLGDKGAVDKISEYDEIVFSNDTCFGPFVSFEEIFEDMEKKECDFWGINYVESGFHSHLQSNFLVFHKNVYNDLVDYLSKLEKGIITKTDACAKFENGLFYYLKKKGYIFGYYVNCEGIDCYKYPDVVIKKYGFPFMKKRCFASEKYLEGNCIEAIKYIRENFPYDYQMIQKVARRKYEISVDAFHKKESLPLSIEKADKVKVSDNDMINFLRKNERVYIYGVGFFGRRVAWLYREYKNIKGFIVTEKKNNPSEVYGLTIYELSEIQNEDVGIIIALNKENTEEIKSNLVKFKNVLYLWSRSG